MVEGTLIVNLDPPYIGFMSRNKSTVLQDCTIEEIKNLFFELNPFAMNDYWPPRECILRVPGDFPKEKLAKFGLIKLATIQPFLFPHKISRKLVVN